MEYMHSALHMGRGAQSFHALSGFWHPPNTPTCSSTWNFSKSPFSRVFIELNLQFSPPLSGGQGVGLKVLTFNHMFGVSVDQPLSNTKLSRGPILVNHSHTYTQVLQKADYE